MLFSNHHDSFISPPSNEPTLLKRAESIAGYTLGELTLLTHTNIPTNLKYDKGWIGLLMEKILGAYAKNKPEQDFFKIGIELKTIPIDKQGNPLETTFICTLSPTKNIGVTWNNCYVRNKLSRVLWMPIEGDKKTPLALRRVGTPFLWSPSVQEEKALHQDWEELMDLVVCSNPSHITARYGEFLQIRPKSNYRNTKQKINTRGFYLKKNFTAAILARYFLL
ncbi:MAG: DNA mismatch repair endonuclease MutH [Candidatus Dasytiphilus stammeri]